MRSSIYHTSSSWKPYVIDVLQRIGGETAPFVETTSANIGNLGYDLQNSKSPGTRTLFRSIYKL